LLLSQTSNLIAEFYAQIPGNLKTTKQIEEQYPGRYDDASDFPDMSACPIFIANYKLINIYEWKFLLSNKHLKLNS